MYYKVLLVDDEAWVAESLKASVNWHANGFEVVGMAHNGTEALTMFEAILPDIVFTDIRMPGMNGLELIKKARELPHKAQFIVVSGYAEFAYAQKALTYGALAYCLKPFDEQDIISILSKFKKNNEAQHETAENPLQLFLEEPNETNRNRLTHKLEQYGLIDGFNDGVGLIVCSTIGNESVQASENYLQVKIGRSKSLYLVAWAQLEKTINEISKGMPDRIRGIGVSEKITEIEKLKESVEIANSLADHYFIAGKAAIFRKKNPLRKPFNEMLKRIDDAIRIGDIAAANVAFDQVLVLFREGSLTMSHALQLYNIVLSFMYQFGIELSDKMLYSNELLLASFGSLSEMIHCLRQYVSRYILEATENVSQEISNETFRAILNYVNQNYIQDISIQSLSIKFYTNPSYISQLFKKEVGETFTAYIAKLRITYACKLLGNTNLMVGEIAEKAGYQDYFYFTKIFKKVVGTTPSRFRAEMKLA
ncbi:response regulator transcription factor [Paenibacillus sp. NRS-1760]|uniref:response regulator transcription factor n=1 Tax=Paenibacillus sp. NRS-1760 TaxID=3233902 RepID=UPI003D267F1A